MFGGFLLIYQGGNGGLVPKIMQNHANTEAIFVAISREGGVNEARCHAMVVLWRYMDGGQKAFD